MGDEKGDDDETRVEWKQTLAAIASGDDCQISGRNFRSDMSSYVPKTKYYSKSGTMFGCMSKIPCLSSIYYVVVELRQNTSADKILHRPNTQAWSRDWARHMAWYLPRSRCSSS